MATLTNTAEAGLLVEIKGPVAYLTLNRPEKRNALSRQVLGELDTAVNTIGADPLVRAIVLAARGTVFCSGHDLSEMADCSGTSYQDLFALSARVMLGLRRMPQPVIARVQGMATAAGCQLVGPWKCC